MLKERIREQYFVMDRNCAESVLGAASEGYGLGITDELLKLISGFGGGLCCERTCGAVCGGLAVIGKLKVAGNAHATEGFKDMCSGYIKAFEDKMGTSNCRKLKERYYNEEVLCLEVIESAAEVLESYIKALDTKELSED